MLHSDMRGHFPCRNNIKCIVHIFDLEISKISTSLDLKEDLENLFFIALIALIFSSLYYNRGKTIESLETSEFAKQKQEIKSSKELLE